MVMRITLPISARLYNVFLVKKKTQHANAKWLEMFKEKQQKPDIIGVAQICLKKKEGRTKLFASHFFHLSDKRICFKLYYLYVGLYQASPLLRSCVHYCVRMKLCRFETDRQYFFRELRR